MKITVVEGSLDELKESELIQKAQTFSHHNCCSYSILSLYLYKSLYTLTILIEPSRKQLYELKHTVDRNKQHNLDLSKTIFQ